MEYEFSDEELDAATREVVAAIDRSADRIEAAVERLIEAVNTQTSVIVHELGGITGP